MDSPKVFEYAKSIGMETLTLMDKLRDWNIPVKSHMAELDPSTIHLIEQKFAEIHAPKTVVAPVKRAAPKKVAKAIESPKKNIVKAKTAKTPPIPEVITSSDSAKSGKVIRRKASEVASQLAKEEEARKIEEDLDEASVLSPTETESPVMTAPPEISQDVIESAPVLEGRESPTIPVSPPTLAPVVQAPVREEVKKEVKAEPRPAPTRVEAPRQYTPRSEPLKPFRSVKKEVVPGTGRAPASSPSNIVGRIDLTRQQRPQSPRPPPRQSTVRTGFVQQPQYQAFVEEPSRREEKRRKPNRPAHGGTEEPAATREEEVETFDAAEFKKRELVFQPKKKKGTLARPSLRTEITTPKALKRVVKVYQNIKLGDLAKEMGVKSAQLVGALVKQGMMVTPNDTLDFETAALIAPEFKYEVENISKTVSEVTDEVVFGDLDAAPVSRAPVVTVMGHVDHGKTSLLDCIRSADVAQGEAGGITQHIGAYKVTTEDGHRITFIDTPGHEAFTAMRARGANVTDIVILVVAADDGVMQQTIEAISHAKNANVPIIVAVNKMDKPGASMERIKQQLTEYQLVAEEWGGQTPFVPVSAIKKTGIKELLEQVILQAEIMELKANPSRSANGIVLESRLERGRGIVATVLLKNGTARLGQYVCAGATWGRIRALFNDRGVGIKEAGPSDPIEVLGLNSPPLAGDVFDICRDEKFADELAAKRLEQKSVKENVPKAKVSLEELFGKIQSGDVKELALVLKSDVVGSQEALKSLLEKASTEKVKIKIVHSAVGGINESDVLLASSSKGIIIGFNVRPEGGAGNLAKSQGIEIKTYSVIYEVVDDIRKAMVGLLEPTYVESNLGRAEVRNLFTVPRIGTIAGSYVLDGKIVRSANVRLIRDGRILYDGKISSLRRFKDDAREVASGYECGIGIEGYNDLKVGDVIEAFEKMQVAGTL